MNHEIELKYYLPDRQSYERLMFKIGDSSSVENQTNYFFDTTDHLLRLQHIFLRLRKSNDTWLFTCKAAPQGIPKPKDTLSIHLEWQEQLTNDHAQKLLNGAASPFQILEDNRPHEDAEA